MSLEKKILLSVMYARMMNMTVLPGLVEDMTDSLYDKEPDSSILSSDKVENLQRMY